MNLASLPFYIVFISLFFPLISVITQSIFLTYFIDIFTFAIFIYYFLFKRNLKLPKILLKFVFIPTAIYLSFIFLNNQPIPSESVIGIIISSLIYLTFISKSDKENQSQIFIKQIKKIYIFLIGALLLEMVLMLFGFKNMLFYPISAGNVETDMIKAYKLYNSAFLFQYLGFSYMVGLNSILMGSQVASQIVANSLIIFSPVYYRFKNNLLNNEYIFFFICLIFYPFVATLTSNLILITILFTLFFILSTSKFNNISARLKGGLSLLILSPLSPLLWFRITNVSDFESYYSSWIQPILFFNQLNFYEKLFGIDFSKIVDLDISADFGFGIMLLNFGLIPFIYLLSLVFVLLLKTFNSLKQINQLDIKNDPWVHLASINILCLLSWFLSIIHYSQAFELGGRHIFSFHIALALISLKKLNESISNNDFKKINFNISNL